MVLCNARQGIHINRTENQQKRLIARQGIHRLPVNPLRGIRYRRYMFSMDRVSLTGNIARQGIHIHRTENRQRRFIARQGIHMGAHTGLGAHAGAPKLRGDMIDSGNHGNDNGGGVGAHLRVRPYLHPYVRPMCSPCITNTHPPTRRRDGARPGATTPPHPYINNHKQNPQ
jgi:hypothetical protein